jgi:hypothetical protein
MSLTHSSQYHHPTSRLLQNFSSKCQVGESRRVRYIVTEADFIGALQRDDVTIMKVVWKRKEVNPYRSQLANLQWKWIVEAAYWITGLLAVLKMISGIFAFGLVVISTLHPLVYRL